MNSHQKNGPTLDNKKIIQGVYAKGKGNFGFIDIEGQAKGFFVFGENTRDALPGDFVEAKVKMFKGREEAIITKVIERRKLPISGTFQMGKSGRFGFVVPKNTDFKKDIFVPGKFSKDAKDGEMVAVEITGWNGKNPEGKVVKVLGDPDAKGVDILAIAVENGARLGWGNAIYQELEKFGKGPTEKQIAKRKDARDMFTITIDGADSKDLDDAVSVEKVGGNYKLSVSIADVAHYVAENHAIDKEARRRGTSIYLVNQVIPMLPEKLSNGLCSLNPHEPKLSLTCEMIINGAGHILESRVYESVIESDFRMTYKEVDQILSTLPLKSKGISQEGGGGILKEGNISPLKVGDDLMFGGKVTKKLENMLQVSRELQHILSGYKKNLGVLGFNFPEPKIIVDEDGNPTDYQKYPMYESNKMIEEFMISANEAVSKQFSKIPFLYRSHEAPDADDLEQLYKRVSQFGFKIENIRKISPKDIANFLDEIEGDPKEKLLGKLTLRSLKKANYTPELLGHFGLAVSYYSHFTSPIRRYPDLQIHRIIKERLHGKLSQDRMQHYKTILPAVAEKSSDAEVKAQQLEYKIRDLMAAKYMKDKVGQEFEGVISGVIAKGFFIELDNTIEGLVDVTSMLDHFEFNDDIMELKGRSHTFSIGDKVRVQLANVNMTEYKIDFEFMEKIDE